MNIEQLKNSITQADQMMLDGNYSGARVFYRTTAKQAEKLELPTLADELRVKLGKAEAASKSENEKILKEQFEADTRRAYCINKVNYNHMKLAKRVSEFLAVNPTERKVDGTFTKKYAEKIAVFKKELIEMLDGSELEIELFRYQHNLEMLELIVKCRWLNIKGQRIEYKTSERIRGNDSNLLELATSRTADFYHQCRVELAEKEKELTDLNNRIHELKRIGQE